MDSYEEMWKAIPAIQLHFYCETCRQLYTKGWFQTAPTQCLFCQSYRAIEWCVTRKDLMRDAEWVFLQTGKEDKGEFYKEYLDQIHRWADAKRISHTKEDIEGEWDLYRQLEDDMGQP